MSSQSPTVDRPSTTPTPRTDPPKVEQMPRWKVLLHNDDVNDQGYVVETILSLTPLTQIAAIRRMLEAHFRGISLLLTTHQERAELYRDQFTSKQLTVTIEPEK
jgi:ATP-dependent Clp protease adaptor protein ClpS